MNQRITNEILLIDSSTDAVKIKDLAQHFKVSDRTIRNDLKEINILLEKNNLDFLDLRNGRIFKTEDFTDLKTIILSTNFYDYKLTKRERVLTASVLLVNSTSYTTLSDIADMLFVSRNTIINDLEKIKQTIKNHDLELKSYPNKGLLVIGKESRKREFLVDSITRADPVINEVISKHVSIEAGNPVLLNKILLEQEHQYGNFLTDYSFNKILHYLGIMSNRNHQGELLENIEGENASTFLMAQDILKYVSQYLDVKVTEDDIRFLSILLHKQQFISKQKSDILNTHFKMLTRQFINEVSEELEIKLNDDYEYFENLVNHLETTFSKPAAYYPEQPILEEVLEENQEVLQVVRDKMPILTKKINRQVTEAEIDYIAIHTCAAIERKRNQEIAFHIVLVCHAGIGTSHLLVEKLRSHFNFRIVDIVSAHEAQFIEPAVADLLISTVPLSNCQIENVTISAVFNDSDFVKISNKLESLRNSRNLPSRINEDQLSARGLLDLINPVILETVPEKGQELIRRIRRIVRDYFKQSIESEAEIFSPYLHHLLPENFITLDVEVVDWKDAVRKSAQKLLDNGFIEERYIDAMIKNIEDNGPYVVMSKGFAVPHEGLDQGSIRVGMNLIRLKHPIEFGDEELDPVEFVCCLSAVDHKTHLKAFFNLVSMLQNPKFKDALREAESSAEAAGIIERFEYESI